MMEKKELSTDEIKKITDSDREFTSMADLVAFIKEDPNAKGMLRTYLAKEENAGFDTLEERIVYLREHFYIASEGTNYAMVDEDNDHLSTETTNYDLDCFETLIKEFKENDYKTVSAESEDEFSSEMICLTESSVIEKGELCITWHGSKLDYSRVMLVEKVGNRLFALGHLLEREDYTDKYWAIFDNRKWILHSEMENIKQVRIVVITADGAMHSQIADFQYTKMIEENEKPLCIDFGTSNTTVGTYGIKSKETGNLDDDIVKFVDITVNPHRTDALMMPTVVYVKSVDCNNPMNTEFLFGYEALKQIEQEEHFEFKASVFYEIKRWMCVPSKKITIFDSENNSVEIERKMIIKAYIDYVIELSEQYFGRRFKKLHFSAPVKLKSLFISTFKELYEGSKEVLDEKDSIDEAFAIVYHYIMQLIDKNKKTVADRTVFIMDCGGGTTDLASCTFSYEQREDYTNELKYQTSFSNGNSNFGGNNITYRIMQLLKIKISEKYCKDGTIVGDAKYLIDKTEDEILNIVESDNNHKEKYDSDSCENAIYSDFVAMYNKCEAIIPTCFADEKDRSDKKRKQRNFFYMWKLAEKIKIEFFSTDQVRIEFGNGDLPIPLRVDTRDDYFWVERTGRLQRETDPLNGIVITNKDVERVICGDIYGLLYGLIKDGKLGENQYISQFNYYKLSGQSCKISLFKELLKEYIPGQKLRVKKENVPKENSSQRLKLECLKGCLQYVRDQKGHELNIIASVGNPRIIYDVYIKNHHAEDEKLFDCKKLKAEEIRIKYFDIDADEMTFDVKNENGKIEKTVDMSLEDKNQNSGFYDSTMLLEKIVSDTGAEKDYVSEIIKRICNHENEEGRNKSTKLLFAIPSADNYGVVFVLIQKIQEGNTKKYKLLNRKHCSFENPDKTFFDGRR